MRYYTPDAPDLSAVPSGMDNDPRADEEIINQQDNEMHPADQSSTAPKEGLASLNNSSRQDISNAIANALDGSGIGIVGSTPQIGEPQKIITEGITGASLEDEEENLAS